MQPTTHHNLAHSSPSFLTCVTTSAVTFFAISFFFFFPLSFLFLYLFRIVLSAALCMSPGNNRRHCYWSNLKVIWNDPLPGKRMWASRDRLYSRNWRIHLKVLCCMPEYRQRLFLSYFQVCGALSMRKYLRPSRSVLTLSRIHRRHVNRIHHLGKALVYGFRVL